MILHLTCLTLLINNTKVKRILTITILIIIFLISKVASNEVKMLAKINNYPISNYDLFKEIQIREILDNKKINQSEHRIILSQIINEKIKELEILKYKIDNNQNEIELKFKNIINNISKDVHIDDQLKKRIKKKIGITVKWKDLVLLKYGNKLQLNTIEIDEYSQNYSLNKEEKEKIYNAELNKKFKVISKTFFNEVKRNYLISYY